MATSTHIAALTALALAAPPAVAHEPAEDTNDHGKLTTSDATPVGAGVLELTLAWQPSWVRAGHDTSGPTGAASIQPLSLRVVRGLSDDLDVGVGLAWMSASQDAPGDLTLRGEGLSDLLLAARWRFHRERRLDLAVIGGVVVPAGLRETSAHLGFTQGFWSGQLALVGSLDEGPLTANLEAGVSAPIGRASTPDLVAVYANAAAGVELGGWCQPALELSWARAFERAGRAVETVSATAGLVVTLPDGYGVAAGLQRLLWGRNAAAAVSALLAVKRAY